MAEQKSTTNAGSGSESLISRTPEIVREILTRILIGNKAGHSAMHFCTSSVTQSWLDGIEINIDTSEITVKNDYTEIAGSGLLTEHSKKLFRFALFCWLKDTGMDKAGLVARFRKSLHRVDLTIEFSDVETNEMDLLFELMFITTHPN